MPALIQFVDSIAASPTVRLDINDGVKWFCTDFSAPPPRLRRSESENAMRDGGVVGSSSYGNRTLTLELTLINATTEDAAATEMQKLWRELDRGTNYLRYQREGMTKPVFFKVFRSDASDLEELWTAPIARNITLELLAEPFAVGLMETIAAVTVSNNPAAATNPCRFDVTGVLGDVPTPALFFNTSALRVRTTIAVRSGVLASSLTTALQAESSITAGVDTTNPGGGPDAAMSGTGTNNFRRTSFATTPGMAIRSSADFVGATGTFAVYAAVRRSDATSVITIGMSRSSINAAAPESTVVLPLTTSRILVKVGTMSVPTQDVGTGSQKVSSGIPRMVFWAQRVSGAGSLDWDCFLIAPADESTAIVQTNPSEKTGGDDAGYDAIFDAAGERAYAVVPGGWTAAAGGVSWYDNLLSGRLPYLAPNTTNRIVWMTESDITTGASAVSTTDVVETYYWPRYLFVRPVTS